MKGVSVLSIFTTLMVIILMLEVTICHASPTDRWMGDEVDDSLVQRVARRLIQEMSEFERTRRTGMSARHGALSNYLKAKALSARIHNPYGPGRRK